MKLAARVVATLASAPSPASSADQSSRLTMSFSGIAAVVNQSARRIRVPRAGRGRRVQSTADRLDDEALGLLVLVLAALQHAEDPARQRLLDHAVERKRGE